MRALVLAMAILGIIAIGIVDGKNGDNNAADPSLAPGHTNTNPGQSDGQCSPPGQTDLNPGQDKKTQEPPSDDIVEPPDSGADDPGEGDTVVDPPVQEQTIP